MKLLFENWRKHLVEQTTEDLKSKAFERVRQQLSNFDRDQRRRFAALLGTFLKKKGLQLSDDKLLNLAHHLGYEQYQWIKKTKVKFLSQEDFVKKYGDRAYGMYHANDNLIEIRLGVSEKELISTLIHELFHAVDHTAFNFDILDKDQTKISKEEKERIKKIIEDEIKPSFVAHNLLNHPTNTFMSILNKRLFDQLMSSVTIITKTGARPKRQQGPDEKYFQQGTERYTRFKNLIDAIQKLNHPASNIVTSEDLVDFCKKENKEKYLNVHSDLDDLHDNLNICKVLRDTPSLAVNTLKDAVGLLNRVAKAEVQPRTQIAEHED